MKFKNLILTTLVLNLSLINLSWSKNECSDYLYTPSGSDSKTLAVIGANYPSLSEGDQNLVLAQTKRTTLEALNSDFLVQMAERQLIHSNYFESITSTAAGSKITPAHLALYTPSEIQELSVKMYQKMQKSFKEKSKDLEHLNNTSKTFDLFLKLPPEFVIDKIGEALILTGTSGDFHKYLVAKKSLANTLNGLGVAVPLGGALVSFLTGLITGIEFDLPIYWGVDGGYRGSGLFEINYYSTGLLGTSVSTSLLAFKSSRIAGYFRSGWLKNRHKEVSGNIEVKEGAYRLALYSETDPSKLSGRILEIDAKIPETDEDSTDLMTFGSELTSINKELTRVFVNDFMHWMVVYKENIERSKDRLKQLKEKGAASTTSKNDSLSMLSNIFIEAGEATKQANITSQKLLKKLTTALKVLNDMDQSEFNDFDKIDWARKSEHIQKAILVHNNFRSYLNRVYRTISDVLASIDSMNLAETAVFVNRMGNQLRNDAEVVKQVDQILEKLEEFENQFENLPNVIN